jgi:purine-binding chemotaxis protein CheW
MKDENRSSQAEATAVSEAQRRRDRENNRYLCFSLGTEEYAIPLLAVREVIAFPEITPVPQAADHFLGIVNLRGQIVSVIDLRRKLSIKPSETAETAVIICDLNPNSIGVVVDSTNCVINPPPEMISEKPVIQSQKNTDYIQAVYREKGKLILLLDISKTLSAGDHQAIARAAMAQRPKAA